VRKANDQISNMLSISHFTPNAPFQRTAKRSNICERYREDRGQASRDLVRDTIFSISVLLVPMVPSMLNHVCDRRTDDRRMGEFLTKASRPKDDGEELKAEAEFIS